MFECLVEECLDLGGKLVRQRIEGFRFGLLGAEYRLVELLADLPQLRIDLRHGLHVHTRVDTQLLAEDIDQLDGRSSRTAGKVPAVGIDDVHTGDDGRKHRCQAVTRRTVGMEIDRDGEVLLEEPHERRHAARRNQTRHVLDGDHVGAESRHLTGLVEEIGVGEDRRGVLLTHEAGPEAQLGIFRIDRIANGAVGDTAILLDILDRRLHVVHIVQGIEDTHDTQTALDRIAAEAVDDLVRIGRVSEQVAAARERREFRHVADGLMDRLEARPGVLVQVAHDRIGHGTAPHLHRIEIRILVERQAAIDLRLIHTRGERRLLSVAQRKVSDFEISCHCDKTFRFLFRFIVIQITKVINYHEFATFS